MSVALGAVLDIGYSGASVVPVCDGYLVSEGVNSTLVSSVVFTSFPLVSSVV